MRVGIVSDTHGLLRPELLRALEGVEHILHAGDVGSEEILDELAAIAPLTAVWGNTDGWGVRGRLPEVAEVELEGKRIIILHGMQLGSPTARSVAALHGTADLVVFGHSHQPEIKAVRNVLTVNPGSAGPRRFGDPVSA
ncbi:MAG: metallophosphatase family protein, partial [Gemmatimonadota bacterium]|nr:metallophosphatase family protein [Gemmatimonadota bacterium]